MGLMCCLGSYKIVEKGKILALVEPPCKIQGISLPVYAKFYGSV